MKPEVAALIAREERRTRVRRVIIVAVVLAIIGGIIAVAVSSQQRSDRERVREFFELLNTDRKEAALKADAPLLSVSAMRSESLVHLTSTRPRLRGGVEITYEVAGQEFGTVVTIDQKNKYSWRIQGLLTEARFPHDVAVQQPRSFERLLLPGEYSFTPEVQGLSLGHSSVVVGADQAVTDIPLELEVTDFGETIAKRTMLDLLALCPATDLPCPDWHEPGLESAWYASDAEDMADAMKLEVTDRSAEHFGGRITGRLPVRFVRDGRFVEENREVSIDLFVDLTTEDPYVHLE